MEMARPNQTAAFCISRRTRGSCISEGPGASTWVCPDCSRCAFIYSPSRKWNGQGAGWRPHEDRKSVVSGKSVSVRVDLGGRRIMYKNLSIIVRILLLHTTTMSHSANLSSFYRQARVGSVHMLHR